MNLPSTSTPSTTSLSRPLRATNRSLLFLFVFTCLLMFMVCLFVGVFFHAWLATICFVCFVCVSLLRVVAGCLTCFVLV